MATNPLVAAADSLAASIKERPTMLAFNVFGTKEIVVYVIVIVVVIALIAWYLMSRRRKA